MFHEILVLGTLRIQEFGRVHIDVGWKHEKPAWPDLHRASGDQTD